MRWQKLQWQTNVRSGSWLARNLTFAQRQPPSSTSGMSISGSSSTTWLLLPQLRNDKQGEPTSINCRRGHFHRQPRPNASLRIQPRTPPTRRFVAPVNATAFAPATYEERRRGAWLGASGVKGLIIPKLGTIEPKNRTQSKF